MKILTRFYWILILCLFLLLPDASGVAQPVIFPVVSQSSPRFFADISFYQGQAGQTQIEMAYSVKLNELTFKEKDNQNTAAITCNLLIKDSGNKVVFQQDREKAVVAKTQAETQDESRGLVDMFVIDLPAGTYSLKISLTDKHSGAVSAIPATFLVPHFYGTFTMSTPLLALAVSTDLTQKQFVKGNRVVWPNVSHEFIHQKSVLQFYFEAYNLIPPTDSTNNFLYTRYLITDLQGDSLLYTPSQVLPKPGTSCAKIAALDIRGFDLGEYTLHVTLEEPGTGQVITQQVAFRIGESAAPDLSLPMTENDIKRYRDQMKFFASKRDLELYDQLDVRGKANFVLEFWRSRDNTPERPENEFMLETFQRMNYAGKNFKGDKGGLNSDMGRVFVIYGRPDDIDRYSMALQGKPYEIWHYYSVLGARHQFVFVDRNNSGIFTLVHSTIDSEIHNYDWLQQEVN